MSEIEKKTITIKDALVTDKSFLDEISKQNNKCTSAEAFSKIIEMAKNNSKNSENDTATQQKFENLYDKHLKLQDLFSNEKALNEKLVAELEELKNQEPKTIEVEKEVEKPLKYNQFIGELSDEVALKARKIRTFALKDGIVNTTTGYDYINQLANVAIEKYINFKYEGIV